MASPPEDPPGYRPPMPSVTRALNDTELSPLVNSSRSPDVTDTAALGGAEMDALLAAERAAGERVAGAQGAAPHAGLARTVVLDEAPAPPPPRPDARTVAFEAMPGLAQPPPAGPSASAPPGAPHPRTTPLPPSLSPDAAFAAASLGAPAAAGSSPVVARATAPAPGARSSAIMLIVALGVASSLAAIVGVLLFSKPSPGSGSAASSGAAVSSGAAIATGAGAASSKPSSAGARPPAASAPSPSPATGGSDAPGDPEVEAKIALTRLREGIGACVRDVIGVMPGTSPPVPLNWALMKGGVYKSLSRDFGSPVYVCAKYKETEPQRFQIQWQAVTKGKEGRGVVWIDTDGDKKPDKAFGFRATLVKKNEAELGEIEPIEPVPAVMKGP